MRRGACLRLLARGEAQAGGGLRAGVRQRVGETVPGYEFYSWYGLWDPAKLPADIVARLNAEVNKALSTDMRAKLESQGLLVSGGSVDDFVKFERDDMAKSQKIITEGKIRAE